MIIYLQTFLLNKLAVSCYFDKKNTVWSAKHCVPRKKKNLIFLFIPKESGIEVHFSKKKKSHTIAY